MLVASLNLIAALLIACGAVQVSVGPRADSTPPSDAISGTPYVPGTVIAGFGKLEPFDSFESAEARLGWRTMRPTDPRFHLVQQGGLLRTDAGVGHPRIEQAYSIAGAELVSVFITQEPEEYSLNTGTREFTEATIGPHDGRLWEEGGSRGRAFWFYSGEMIEAQRVRVLIYTHQNNDLSDDDFKAFVASLDFEDSPPTN